MMQTPPTESITSEDSLDPLPSEENSGSIDPFKILRILCNAGGDVFKQAALHGQLAQIEWAEEKNRLFKLGLFAALSFVSFLFVMLFGSLLALALSWDTPYRLHTLLMIMVFYMLLTVVAWRRFKRLSALGSKRFAATREEISLDLKMLKSHL
jgi:uncharacterized membrane protein YqjE